MALQLDSLMAEEPKELVNCQSIEVLGEGGTLRGSADLNLHPVEVSFSPSTVIGLARKLADI